MTGIPEPPSLPVLQNYLRTTLRVLRRQASFSIINLVGLSVGVAVSLLLFLFVQHESSYDRMHAEADRLYRAWVMEDWGENQQFFNTLTPLRIGPDLAAGIPEVEAFVRYDRLTDTVRRNETGRSETLFIVDANFLDVFDFEVIAGDRGSMFAQPDAIVLTAEAATRHFGAENPVGQTLSLDNGGETRSFVVSGILADPPENSSLQFEMLVSFGVTEWLYPAGAQTAWFSIGPETYILLREGAGRGEVEAKIPALLTGLMGDAANGIEYTVGLQPLTDIHLDPAFPVGYASVVNPVYVRILGGIAALILLIACINFVTLSVARSTGRAKEVGVRKAIGANRTQLMAQYWGEALVFTAVSVAVGAALAAAALPAFNSLAQRTLALTPDAGTLGMVVGLFAVVSLLAGAYPAFVLSEFRPVEAFRRKAQASSGRSGLRKVLVAAQLIVSMLLVASTLIMGQQLRYVEERDLGYDRESVVVLTTSLDLSTASEVADRLRFETGRTDEVRGVATSMMVFDTDGWGRIGYEATDGTYRRFFANVVDHEFVETLGLRMREGRPFDPQNPSDASSAVLINRAFADAYGWDRPLEETIPGDFAPHSIIGVVENFHFASLRESIRPALMVLDPALAFSGAQDFDYDGTTDAKISVRLAGSSLSASLAALEGAWGRAAPGESFRYHFLDDALADQYRQEVRLSGVARIGALLALFIAALGLFGLTALSAATRSKEIGLRKVLGASLASILGLFYRETGLLVAIALAVAVPVTWMGMSSWLAGFAYRTSVGVWPFVVAALAALAVTAFAVGSNALKAATADPAVALRDE